MVSEVAEPDQPARVVDHVQNRCFPAGQHVKFERNKSRLQRKRKKKRRKDDGIMKQFCPSDMKHFFFHLQPWKSAKSIPGQNWTLWTFWASVPTSTVNNNINTIWKVTQWGGDHSTLPHWGKTLLVLICSIFFGCCFFNPTYIRCFWWISKISTNQMYLEDNYMVKSQG